METLSSATQNLAGPMKALTWAEVKNEVAVMFDRIRRSCHGVPRYIHGIPRGGAFIALMIQARAHYFGFQIELVDEPEALYGKELLVVDDLIDSGNTLSKYSVAHRVDALYRKPYSPHFTGEDARTREGWITFPWETAENEGTGAEDLVIRLLQYIGEDPTRDGLKETPKRVLKAWAELTAGYKQDPKAILNKSFDEPHDELILLRGIEFHSTCEHHLLPFYGTAAVGYIPQKSVVGISKLARLVDCYARRLQIQERLTKQIADAIREALSPVGVGVVIKAKHSCMGCRGVMKPDSDMVTSVMQGLLREDAAARSEFLSLVKL